MNIIAVDDEELALAYLVRILGEAEPECEIQPFLDPFDALQYVKSHPVDLAFLDVEMYGLDGIDLAKRFKDTQPDINIIFVTGFPDYAVDAFSLHASGYLLKPVSVKSIHSEIASLRNPIVKKTDKKIRVQTFGSFEVFNGNIPLEFSRIKSKELFAYLIDRKGAGSTTAELSAVLWEDREYSISLQKQFQTIVSDMMKTLKSAEAEDVVIKKRNFISVDTSKIECDYYDFLNGDVRAINSYAGEYMSNYSWAEFTTGYLYRQMHE